MPLLDEHTQRSDRRPPAWRAWLAAAVVLVVIWVAFTVGVSYISRQRALSPPAGGVAAQVQSQVLTDAEQRLSFGDTTTAVQMLSRIDSSRLSLMDKHTYLRVGAEAMSRHGSPAGASRYLDRYLSMSAQLYSGNCSPCHTPPNAVPPTRYVDMTTSERGKQYVEALRKAGILATTQKKLTADWKRKPDDVRLNVLLYHLQLQGLKDRPAALRHADRLKALDKNRTVTGL